MGEMADKSSSAVRPRLSTLLLQPFIFRLTVPAAKWWQTALPFFVPLGLVWLWLLMPLSPNITGECKSSHPKQSLFLEIMFHAIYVSYSAGQAYAFLVVLLQRPPFILRVIVCLGSGVLAALSRYGLGKLDADNLFLFVLNTIIWTSLPQIILQLVLIRKYIGPAWLQSDELKIMGWSQLLLGIIILWYTWCESNLYIMKHFKTWHTPVFLPVVFSFGLWILRVIGKNLIACRLCKLLETRNPSLLEPSQGISTTNAPFILLETAYQYFYFVFFRQLFFTVEDPLSMAMLQMNAMVLDTINALSALRFSSVVRSSNQVMLVIDVKHIESQGMQLGVRQVARVTSLIGVVSLTSWLRFGYNRCFYDPVYELSSERFSRLIGNFFVMFAWELVFVLALYFVLKRSLGLDLLLSIKDILATPWVRGIIMAQTTHYLSDPYFGLHHSAI